MVLSGVVVIVVGMGAGAEVGWGLLLNWQRVH